MKVEEIKKLCKIIEQSEECITYVEPGDMEVDEDETYLYHEFIAVDDRLDGGYNMDNNTHNLAEELQNKGFPNVEFVRFARMDAYPDGTATYSISIDMKED